MPSNPDPFPAAESPERKLVAILSADVAGYSALMGRDEASTVRTLSELRAVVRTCVGRYNGKVDDAKGDAVLAEFASAVNAVACAVEIQRQLAERNASLPDDRKMHLRIGVNLGDVIVKDDTVYGDGVNIAARLEALAAPGAICISRMVYDNIRNKLPLTCESLGKKSMKNIAEPVEVFRVIPPGAVTGGLGRTRRRGTLVLIVLVLLAGGSLAIWTALRTSSNPDPTTTGQALKLPEEPSIAVLPFSNLGGKPEEDWFSDGMTETLITDLSRLDNLFVIARNSTFTFKGKPVDVRRVGRELGVRYVLEGSVQRTDERLRVNAQLVEANTGRHLWAERYDRKLADLFEIQDDITQQIVTELDVKLLTGEQARTWRKTTRNREAYDLYLRGEAHLQRYTQEDIARAQETQQRALELDPKFTMAMVLLGWTHYHQGDAGWSADSRESYRKAVEIGRRAVAIDPSLGEAHAMLATVLLTLQNHAEAIDAARKALAMTTNQADAVVLASWVLALTGRAEEAVPLVERAIRRNPFTPDWYYGAMGDSLLFANRVEEALPAQRKCAERLSGFLWCQLGLTVTYVESGKLEPASAQAKEAVKINPKITAEDNTYVRSLSPPKDRARAIDALRRAGIK